jgi:hypothetical protein
MPVHNSSHSCPLGKQCQYCPAYRLRTRPQGSSTGHICSCQLTSNVLLCTPGVPHESADACAMWHAHTRGSSISNKPTCGVHPLFSSECVAGCEATSHVATQATSQQMLRFCTHNPMHLSWHPSHYHHHIWGATVFRGSPSQVGTTVQHRCRHSHSSAAARD